MTERALATVEEISSISPIPDADAIEVAKVRGWEVVVRKGEFAPGDRCVYVEIDSWLPIANPAFAFLAPRGVRKLHPLDDSPLGHVLRTAKLRGQVSQGLVLPIDVLSGNGEVGSDVTEALGIYKYEPPIPSELSGDVVGKFPSHWARKTDAERIQNLTSCWAELVAEGDWFATEKIDGTSMTVIRDETGELRVCGRNWEYKPGATPDDDNTLWRMARKHAGEMPPGDYFQAELFGPGIQKNPLQVPEVRVAIFGYGSEGEPYASWEWPDWAMDLRVPVYWDLILPDTIEGALAQVDTIDSLVTPGRRPEGLVWHDSRALPFPQLDGRSCFKVISNTYLLKLKEDRC